MKKRRVAITGLGAVSPIGLDVQSTWSNLLAGTSGIAEIKHFDASAFTTCIAAEVKNFKPNPSLTNKHTRFSMSFTEYALEAAYQAFEDAGILPTEQTATQWGVVTGSGMMTAEFNYLHRFQKCAHKMVMWIGIVYKKRNTNFISYLILVKPHQILACLC